MLEALETQSVTPYLDTAHEWVTGTAGFAFSTADPAYSRIVDLGLIQPDDDGKVRVTADVRILRPAQPNGGHALVVVPNRGMLGAIPFALDAEPTFDTGAPHPGDRFLLDRGWTIAWCGWQWDVIRPNGWLGLDAPRASVPPGSMRVEFRPDVDQPQHALSDSSFLFVFTDYPTVDVDDRDAVLTVRTTPLGEKREVPRNEWRFSDATHVEIDGGFRAFHWYELVYRSSTAPVVGTGLLAVRDFGAYLRESHDKVFAFGVSQSGRFLRELLHLGLNLDEQGRQVFDGVFAHIAGGRRGEFNHRYGQPSLTHPLTPGYGPPFDTTRLLSFQRSLGGVPKVLFTNSSWEYWRGDGALVHQDDETGADLPEDPDARCFLISGTDHIGSYAIKDSFPVSNPAHKLDIQPLMRALLVQLDQWVCEGIEPSPSQVPRHGDGTATTRPEVLARFSTGHLPDPASLPFTPAIDPDTTTWPLELGPPRAGIVSTVDNTGNELAGIRLPAIAVPAAAYTGWNPRVHVEGLPDVLYEFTGSKLPLQSGAVPADRAAYEAEVASAAAALVRDRLLLAEGRRPGGRRSHGDLRRGRRPRTRVTVVLVPPLPRPCPPPHSGSTSSTTVATMSCDDRPISRS